jgi:hypothetical protein
MITHRWEDVKKTINVNLSCQLVSIQRLTFVFAQMNAAKPHLESKTKRISLATIREPRGLEDRGRMVASKMRGADFFLASTF